MEVKKYNCRLVEVTGGEPLLQENILPFLIRLCDEGFDVLLETGGHMSIKDIDQRVKKIVDIKCPSSGEVNKVFWPNMELLKSSDQIKFVVGDLKDYTFAKETIAKYNLEKK